ncbi:hypothetical protein [Fibrivirga algicola]|uniref:UrcA family protein n=1 Tax=Fibrivirga algicola TaxID=2950420 RepID=A0ABX0QH99_9BACT|nr:hypothetical protein [Fibrivirga algicola]NID11599.1 hypothetical protein [Fibrivirga algicola]
MKKLVAFTLFTLPFLGFISLHPKKAEPKQAYYYFCLSREVLTNEESTAKRQLLYTDIREVTADETDIRRLANQFANYVKAGCKPGNDLCTSDLNCYTSIQEAEKRQKGLLTSFNSTGKYDLKKIDVKLD